MINFKAAVSLRWHISKYLLCGNDGYSLICYCILAMVARILPRLFLLDYFDLMNPILSPLSPQLLYSVLKDNSQIRR